jgi:hypothetical protein
MKRIHLVFGLSVMVVFLLTGQYMEYVHNRLLPDGTRVLYRSRHIYLLLAGLINLVRLTKETICFGSREPSR